MENQEIYTEELVHKIEMDSEIRNSEKIKKQKKILNSAIKHLKKLAIDKLHKRVGEC